MLITSNTVVQITQDLTASGIVSSVSFRDPVKVQIPNVHVPARLWNEICSSYYMLNPSNHCIILLPDHARVINFYGERYPRLFRSQLSVPEEPSKSSRLMKIVFLLLFDAPSTHLTTLQEFYIDQVIYSEGWRKFIEVLLKDWQDFILWVRRL
jgi:hypothetical protein